MNGQLRLAGFGMIEMLITVTLLSVGFMGIMGMQINAKQSQLEAWQRTQASFYLNNFIERMRINNTRLAEYDIAQLTLFDCPINPTKQSDIDKCVLMAALNDAQMGLNHWELCIDVDGVAGSESGQVNVILTWTGVFKLKAKGQELACLNGFSNDVERQYARQIVHNAFIKPSNN